MAPPPQPISASHDEFLSNWSIGHNSPPFSTARTHQATGTKISSRIFYPRLDSSETTPSPTESTCIVGYWHFKEKDGDPYHTVATGTDIAVVEGNKVSCSPKTDVISRFDEEEKALEPLLRSHGAPLETITEKSSLATLPLVLSGSKILSLRISRHPVQGLLPRHCSASAAMLPVDSGRSRQTRTRSLDEGPLKGLRRASSLNAISESSELNKTGGEVAYPQRPQLQPPERMQTPTDCRRWLTDIPTSVSKASDSKQRRKTSAYVRNIYTKLVGGYEHDAAAILASSKTAGTNSTNPVPKSMAHGGRTGTAYWGPPASNHTGRTSMPLKGCALVFDSAATASPKRPGYLQWRNTAQLLAQTNENDNPVNSRKRSFSYVWRQASRLFDTPVRRQAPDEERVKFDVNLERTCTSLDSEAAMELFNYTTSTLQPVFALASPQSRGQTSPSKSATTSVLMPEPLTVRRKTAVDAGDKFTQDITQTPQTARCTLPDSPIRTPLRTLRSPVSSRSSSTSLSSWVLPLQPFPRPPSPSTFRTPPLYSNTRDHPLNDRSTQDGIPILSPFAASLRSFDASIDEATLDSIKPSNSSTSVVAGGSFYQHICDAPMSDPFVNRPFFHWSVMDERSNLGDRHLGPSTSSTPVHIPSPLRPRARPAVRYTLFPSETTSPITLAKKPSVGQPILRTLRSFSSMMKGSNTNSVDPKPQKLQRVRLPDKKRACPHGRLIKMRTRPTLKAVGIKGWHPRHWMRDGLGRCWKCSISRKLKVLGQVECLLPRKGSCRKGLRLRTSHPAIPPQGTRPREDQCVAVPHPLDEIEQARVAVARESTSDRRFVAPHAGLASRLRICLPTCCFRQIVADDETAAGPQPLNSETVKRVKIRRAIE